MRTSTWSRCCVGAEVRAWRSHGVLVSDILGVKYSEGGRLKPQLFKPISQRIVTSLVASYRVDYQVQVHPPTRIYHLRTFLYSPLSKEDTYYGLPRLSLA
jgi:hypothetical protein